MLVVVAIIAIALGFLVPALGIGSARALEGDTRQFLAQLENARQTAIAERTRTRVIIPVAQETPRLGENLPLRAYTITSLDRTTGIWKQRGNWNRLSQSVAFNKGVGVLNEPVSDETKLPNNTKHTGPYIEYRANGSTSLDPATAPQLIELADAIADNAGTFRQKNAALRFQVEIDPLTGSATIK